MFENFFLHASPLLQLMTLVYLLATGAYIVSAFMRNELLNKICLGLFITGFGLNLTHFILRWMEAGRAPIKSRFEALLLLALTIGILSIAVEVMHKVRFMGLFSSISIMVTIYLAFLWYDTLIQNLPAALQSYWFVPHVTVYFFGYAAGAIAFFSAVAYLFLPKPKQLKPHNLLGQEVLDFEKYTYKLAVFAFVMLGLGLVQGALWAKEAWGTYWAWDPKENWALISFLVIGMYLHFRFLPGWKGKKATWIVIIAFVTIIITFLGVTYLPSAQDSMHVYLD
jgi:cytochrome c-type biogenesis protein CcsB